MNCELSSNQNHTKQHTTTNQTFKSSSPPPPHPLTSFFKILKTFFEGGQSVTAIAYSLFKDLSKSFILWTLLLFRREEEQQQRLPRESRSDKKSSAEGIVRGRSDMEDLSRAGSAWVKASTNVSNRDKVLRVSCSMLMVTLYQVILLCCFFLICVHVGISI